MRKALLHFYLWVGQKLGLKAEETQGPASSLKATADPEDRSSSIIAIEEERVFIESDDDLLDRSKTQWHCGDWEGLSRLTEERIAHHPDRAKLAILAAAAHQQIGSLENTRTYVSHALQWGCKPKLVRQILISGTYNTLARASSALGDEQRAIAYFQAAVDTGSRHSDRVVARLRMESELGQLGVPMDAIAQQSRLTLTDRRSEETS